MNLHRQDPAAGADLIRSENFFLPQRATAWANPNPTLEECLSSLGLLEQIGPEDGTTVEQFFAAAARDGRRVLGSTPVFKAPPSVTRAGRELRAAPLRPGLPTARLGRAR